MSTVDRHAEMWKTLDLIYFGIRIKKKKTHPDHFIGINQGQLGVNGPKDTRYQQQIKWHLVMNKGIYQMKTWQ